MFDSQRRVSVGATLDIGHATFAAPSLTARLESNQYLENARAYNNAFAFTSLGVKVDDSINRGCGPPTFRIQGELCHRIGSLLPLQGQEPVFSQIYVFDPTFDDQLARRLSRQSTGINLDVNILRRLQYMLNENNPHMHVYRNAGDRIRNDGHGSESDIVIRFLDSSTTNRDPRRYNAPTAHEVAMIIGTDKGENVNAFTRGKDVVVQARGTASNQ
jgi:hypothetical protein